MIVGITTTFVEEKLEDEPTHVERVTTPYIQRVAAAGATPVLLPPVPGGVQANRRAAADLAERIDALVLAGGGDVSPSSYGDASRLPWTENVSEDRDALELELVRLAHERDLPTLGICRGMQVMNVALGGKLCQDLVACGATAVGHRQKPPYDAARQRISVAPGSALARILFGRRRRAADTATPCTPDESERFDTFANSMHHQAVSCIAPRLTASAFSDDGVIEGIEDATRRFFIGVQWHPEYLDEHASLFRSLVDAVR